MNYILHHCDPDGWCAAHLAVQFLERQNKKYQLIECRYGDEGTYYDPEEDMVYVNSIPLKDNYVVWIVDFSFTKNIMKWIDEHHTLIWIDHHASAIEKVESLLPDGIRDVRFSGCELTWIYLHHISTRDNYHTMMRPLPDDVTVKFVQSNMEMPLYVRLIGDYDTWRWQANEYTGTLSRVADFQYGIRHFHDSPDGYPWTVMDSLFHNIMGIGTTIADFVDEQNRAIIKAMSWTSRHCISITDDIYVDLICMNGPKSSLAWGNIIDKYPDHILVSYNHNGKQFSVSLRSKRNTLVRFIAELYGGGGHDLAAGFSCKELPFAYIEKFEASND